MTLFKTLGFSAALVAALAITGGVALANGNGKNNDSVFAFMRLPSVTIGTEGKTLVRGAEVTSVADGSFTARTEWDDTTLTWTVDTDSDTSYVDRDGDEIDRDDIDDGDIVSFSGALTGNLTVDTAVVREWPADDDSDDDNDEDDDKRDNGVHRGWNKPFVDFWSNVKARFHN